MTDCEKSRGQLISELNALRELNAELDRQISNIIECINGGFYALDRDWRFTCINSVAEKVFGNKREAFIGKVIWQEIPRAVGTKIFKEFHAALASQTSAHFETFHPGMLKWIEIYAYPSAEGLSVYFRDISERKQREMKLRESEERYRSLYENSADGIILCRPGDAILAANPAACRMFGLAEEELRELGMAGIIDINDPAMRSAMGNMARTGNFKCEAMLIHKDGTKFPGELSSSLFRGKDDRYLSSLIIRDIRERRRSEEALLLLANIVESSDDAIIGGSLDGIIVSWNPGAENIFGYSADEIRGCPISSLVPADMRREMHDNLVKLAGGKAIKKYKTVGVKKDGRFVDVSISVSPLRGPGGRIEGFSSIVRDITEQQKMEQEMARLDRLNMVGQMAAGIGHEIRNPMTAIRGLLQLLRIKPECENYAEYFKLMIGELDRANSIITEYLAVARDKPVERTSRNINAIIGALSPLLIADAMNEKKYLKINEQKIPDLLLDEKEIRQLVLNLVRNGLEAMSPGGCITIKTFCDNREVVLSVKDQGTGIDSAVLEKIGTPFFTTKDKGTGLGMATCYSIAARHKATIDIDTGPGGTTFFVRFKL